jgi:predicted acyl esterase
VEVEPILEVLVGKTLEQGMLEVMEEDEFAAMMAHRREIQQRRNAELAEVQRQEAAERRRFEEKERRKQQEKARLAAERRAKEKMASRKFAKNFVSDLQGSVFAALEEAGFFYDTVEREVETTFMAALEQQAMQVLERKRQNRQQVDGLINKAIQRALQLQEETRIARLKKEAEERERIRKEEEERLRRLAEEEAERQRKLQAEQEARERAAAEAAQGEEGEGGEEAEAEEEES